MKFNKIKISEPLCHNEGISAIDFKARSNIIAFVGKNGSGKTRILKLLEKYLFEEMTIFRILDDSISCLPKELEDYKSKISPYKEHIKLLEEKSILEDKIENNPNKSTLLQNDLIGLKSNLDSQYSRQEQSELNNLILKFKIDIKPKLQKSYIRYIENEKIKNISKELNKSTKQPQNSFENLIENLRDEIKDDEIESICSDALNYFAKLPDKLAFEYYECFRNSKKFEESITYKRYESFKGFLKTFLKKDLIWEQSSAKGNLTESGYNVIFKGIFKLDDRIFTYDDLSEGEKLLFAYALLFFLLDQNPNLPISESIIIMDEPELHLHPAMEIKVIQDIREIVEKKGQLIIATHSINIKSHLNNDEIFVVREGKITHPQISSPTESLSELIGLEDRIYKLSEFLDASDSWFYTNFVVQCFDDPEVIDYSGPNDPQVEEFKDKLKSISTKKTKKINVLDFGAGQGRLLNQLQNEVQLFNHINYEVLEPKTEFHENLISLGAKKTYEKIDELPNVFFDIVVLCNVLHEIKLGEWINTLNKIISSIKSDGFLFIIEAKMLKKGEKIGTAGFLLLDYDELKILFNLSNDPSKLKIEDSESKIISTLISKKNLKEITLDSLGDCIEALAQNTLNKIETLRNKVDSVNKKQLTKELKSSFGREAAFLSQQNINAQLGIKFLLEEKKQVASAYRVPKKAKHSPR